jgi:hypothetical protein
MRYVKINWIHNHNDEPLQIYSEIGEDGYEIRKVEVFKNQKFGYAKDDVTVNGTALSDEIFPDLSELNGKDEWDEMNSAEILQDDFESIWNIATQER